MIVMFLANGFEEVEALTPLDYLRRVGEEIVTVGIGGKQITGSHGIIVSADISEDELSFGDVSMVILPGGGVGTANLAESKTVAKALDIVTERGLPVAAICAAPSVLGQRGMLQGKKATCYPGFEDKLLGAQVEDAPVVVDGGTITARGAGAAQQFAFALVSFLQGEPRAEELQRSVRWK